MQNTTLETTPRTDGLGRRSGFVVVVVVVEKLKLQPSHTVYNVLRFLAAPLDLQLYAIRQK